MYLKFNHMLHFNQPSIPRSSARSGWFSGHAIRGRCQRAVPAQEVSRRSGVERRRQGRWKAEEKAQLLCWGSILCLLRANISSSALMCVTFCSLSHLHFFLPLFVCFWLPLCRCAFKSWRRNIFYSQTSHLQWRTCVTLSGSTEDVVQSEAE